jgi:hypothetical protein
LQIPIHLSTLVALPTKGCKGLNKVTITNFDIELVTTTKKEIVQMMFSLVMTLHASLRCLYIMILGVHLLSMSFDMALFYIYLVI